jgi:hypothetical protein
MHSTCTFCHAPLGANAMVEHFPVGRRLAFDADRGRLWVACAACRQWNLSPLEERWEAIEAPLQRRVMVAGDEAVRAARAIMPRINRTGGRRRTVQEAVRVLEQTGSMHASFQQAARTIGRDYGGDRSRP